MKTGAFFDLNTKELSLKLSPTLFVTDTFVTNICDKTGVILPGSMAEL